jgi:hypothetical protein
MRLTRERMGLFFCDEGDMSTITYFATPKEGVG